LVKGLLKAFQRPRASPRPFKGLVKEILKACQRAFKKRRFWEFFEPRTPWARLRRFWEFFELPAPSARLRRLWEIFEPRTPWAFFG